MAFLEVKNISKQFGGLQALNGVSFSLEKGEIAGLIGPNGAGKTTLFNVVSGYYPPNSGDVIFEGRQITNSSPHVICRLGIGRTFQICKPFPQLSVLENVLIGANHWARSIKEARQAAERAIEIVQLDVKKEFLAQSLSTPERKKLELARALASNPTTLLLDEPAAGLNPTELKVFLDTVKTVASSKNLTILIVEHILQVIMGLSLRIIVLDEGVIIAEGVPEKIAKDPKVIAAYLGDEYVTTKGG
jgi:branched-chain amino acid transport system ATP-binding protein